MVRYKARECYIHRKMENDDFLIPVGRQIIKKNGLILMNETAAFLWNEIQKEKTADELCKALSEDYGIECEDVADDVMKFIDDMLSLDAIERIEYA